MFGPSSEQDFKGCWLAGHGLLLLTTPSLFVSTLPTGRPITGPLHQLGELSTALLHTGLVLLRGIRSEPYRTSQLSVISPLCVVKPREFVLFRGT